jgi:hypothetical protein
MAVSRAAALRFDRSQRLLPHDAAAARAAGQERSRIMGKGRLLASVCALGLIVAAPAFAADTDNQNPAPAGTTSGAATSTGTGTSQPAAAAGGGTEASPAKTGEAGAGHMHPSRHAMRRNRRRQGQEAMRRSGRGGDRSQNAAVDQLNEQSLQAARRGEPFMGGNDNAPAQGGGGAGGAGAPPSGNTKM